MTNFIKCNHIETREQATVFMNKLWDELTTIWENPKTRPDYSYHYARVVAAKRYLINKGLWVEETEDVFA